MENENIIILSMAVIMAMQPIHGDDIKKLDDKPVDEGKSTEILRGGKIKDSNISIEIQEDIIEIKILIFKLVIRLLLRIDLKIFPK